MANNPIDNNGFTFFLRFNSLNRTDWYEISEFIGFDAAKFVVEQKEKGFARDIRYVDIDQATFVDAVGIKINQPQIVNPLGDSSNRLDYGLQWLIYIYDVFGFEMDVDVMLKVDGNPFVTYSMEVIDDDVTDGYSYFKAKLIDNSKVADYKRREEDKLNMFSTKGVFEQNITPIETFNYLKRATPVLEQTIFELKTDLLISLPLGQPPAYNPIRNNTEYGITDTLGFLSITPADPSDELGSFSYIRAANTKTNIEINFDINYQTLAAQPFRIFVWAGRDGNSLRYTNTLTNPIAIGTVNYSPTLTIPVLYPGERMAIWFFAGRSVQFYPSKVTIKAIASDDDIVISAAKFVDLFKQTNKMFHNLNFFANNIDTGGAMNKQAVFNKQMISKKNEKLFLTQKDLYETLDETCHDIEINDSEMFIGHYPNYYTNDEIGSQEMIPEESTTIGTNERFAINKYEPSYSKYAQEREIDGSNESVNTQAQYKIQNNKVQNTKEFKMPFIRDRYLIGDIIQQQINKPSTSTEESESICLEDMIELSPNSYGIIYRQLGVRKSGSNLEVFNRTFDEENPSVFINWELFGITVGQQVEEVLGGDFAGFYTVLSITRTILTLQPNFSLADFEPYDYFISLKYYYSNVLWQTRTDEGFSLIENAPRKSANLNYTIKRIIIDWWKKYLATALMYSKKDLINTGFKSVGLKTQLSTESTPVVEADNIPYAEFPEPLLTGKTRKITIVTDYEKELEYLRAYQTPAPGTTRRQKGFERFYDLNGNVFKGYRKMSENTISENKLTITIEEKYEPSVLKINIINGALYVNDTIYRQNGNLDWFKTENDFVQFFDNKNRPISNRYAFNFINLNGTIYTSINDLVIALNSIILTL